VFDDFMDRGDLLYCANGNGAFGYTDVLDAFRTMALVDEFKGFSLMTTSGISCCCWSPL